MNQKITMIINDRKEGSAWQGALQLPIYAIGRLASVWRNLPSATAFISVATSWQRLRTLRRHLRTRPGSIVKDLTEAFLSEAEGFRSIKLTDGGQYATQRCIPQHRGVRMVTNDGSANE